MSKPYWKDAPEWAQFLAMDGNGDWYWYEVKPDYESLEWWSDYRYELAKDGLSPSKSLERRP